MKLFLRPQVLYSILLTKKGNSKSKNCISKILYEYSKFYIGENFRPLHKTVNEPQTTNYEHT